MTSSKPDSSREEGLSALLDVIIPADSQRGLPSGSQVGFIPEAWAYDCVQKLNSVSTSQYGREFQAITPAERLSLIDGLDRAQKTALTRLAKQLAETYYLRPEIAKATGASEDPPFPAGHCVEEGDLTLLEPVYLRGRIYRDL